MLKSQLLSSLDERRNKQTFNIQNKTAYCKSLNKNGEVKQVTGI